MIGRNIPLAVGLLVLLCALAVQAGCPFDDGSCQEYCNQQGCNLGYCGHFAWIQCICRKCGDEWNWYDKVHYNPDKQVNQTELDSLKLNVSGPIILTNNNKVQSGGSGQQQQQQQQQVVKVAPSTSVVGSQQEQAATLTTLLIPDLSDGSKLDLNDIPDENSEKFLDYLAKNHEKLAQATNSAQGARATAATLSDEESDNDDESESIAEETVEIQISSSDNQRQQIHTQAQPQPQPPQQQPRHQQAASRQPNSTPNYDENDDNDEQRQRAAGSQVTRLLKMAVAERSSDDIF